MQCTQFYFQIMAIQDRQGAIKSTPRQEILPVIEWGPTLDTCSYVRGYNVILTPPSKEIF